LAHFLNPAKTHFDATGTSTAEAVMSVGGYLIWLEVSNPNTADAFLQLFDVAVGNVTVGSTSPKMSLLVPAGASATVRGAMDKDFDSHPVKFGTAMTYACTTTPTGNTNPSSALTINIGYID
jgi:hypothetical protein